MYGCVKRSSSSQDADEEVMQEKKKVLKDWHSSNEGQRDEIVQEMTLTYTLQRKMIDSKMPTRELPLEWPYLFQPEGMFMHFQELVGVDIEAVLPAAFRTKGMNILKFSEHLAPRTPTVAEILEDLAQASGPAPQNDAVAITLLLLHYLEEAEDGVLLLCEAVPRQMISNQLEICVVRGRSKKEFSTASDVEKYVLPASPRIIVLGDSPSRALSFMITVDQTVVTDHITQYGTAVGLWFALHYVLNLAYAQES